jgi:polysaccharide biosynthesis/export protein ExoF
MLLTFNPFRLKSRSAADAGGSIGAIPRRILAWAWLAGVAWISQGGLAWADATGYELGPQDKIRVSVIEWFTGAGELRSPINGEYTVSPNGFVSLPLLGDVRALGLEPPALANDVSEKLQAKLSLSERPITSIEIVQFRPFFVMGDLERPGEYAYRPGITALQAVSLAGGFYRASSPTPAKAQRDAMQAAGERRSVGARITELTIRRVRLEAELKNAETVEFPPDLTSRSADPVVAAAMRLEGTIFEARRRAFTSSVTAQKKLVDLYRQEILALNTQAESLERHRDVTKQQADNLRSLQSRGLATMGREFDIDRMLADVAIRKQELDVKTETSTQEADARRRQEIAVELQSLQSTLDDLQQRLLLADQTLSETEIAASRNQWPIFKLVRQSASGEQSEIVGTASTPLKPGDILIVQFTRPEGTKIAGSGAGGNRVEAASRDASPMEVGAAE